MKNQVFNTLFILLTLMFCFSIDASAQLPPFEELDINRGGHFGGSSNSGSCNIDIFDIGGYQSGNGAAFYVNTGFLGCSSTPATETWSPGITVPCPAGANGPTPIISCVTISRDGAIVQECTTVTVDCQGNQTCNINIFDIGGYQSGNGASFYANAGFSGCSSTPATETWSPGISVPCPVGANGQTPITSCVTISRDGTTVQECTTITVDCQGNQTCDIDILSIGGYQSGNGAAFYANTSFSGCSSTPATETWSPGISVPCPEGANGQTPITSCVTISRDGTTVQECNTVTVDCQGNPICNIDIVSIGGYQSGNGAAFYANISSSGCSSTPATEAWSPGITVPCPEGANGGTLLTSCVTISRDGTTVQECTTVAVDCQGTPVCDIDIYEIGGYQWGNGAAFYANTSFSDCSSTPATETWSPGITVPCPEGANGGTLLTSCVTVSRDGITAQECTTVAVTCGSSSIINNRNNQATISPNPARNNFLLNYTLPEESQEGEIILVNTQGKQVLQKRLYPDGISESIDVSNLPRGLYFIRIEADGKSVHQSKVVLTN